MTDSSRTDYGWITVEDTGNTSIHANFTYDHNGPDLNSKGEPTLEATEWLIDDFYIQHEGKKYSLASKTIRYANDIPRHAEVINDRVFLLYGSLGYPESEEVQERISKYKQIYGPEFEYYMVGSWFMIEIEPKEKGEILAWILTPEGTFDSPKIHWDYEQLNKSELVRKIFNGVNTDATSINERINLLGTSGENESLDWSNIMAATTITAPSKFNKKSADKITNFNPSTDTLEIDIDSFKIDSSATFASGKNKKKVKKKLAKKDFDFLYDEKKGGLYFNENGADKGFGEGGIIAILKGAPDLTASNLEFI